MTFTSSAKIARPIAQVFDFVVDPRNDLRWNPRCTRVEQITAGEIASGTQFRGDWRGAKNTQITIEAFERPTRCVAVGVSSGMHWRHTITCAEASGGTALNRTLEVTFEGALALFSFFIAPIVKRQTIAQTDQMKRALERANMSPPT